MAESEETRASDVSVPLHLRVEFITSNFVVFPFVSERRQQRDSPFYLPDLGLAPRLLGLHEGTRPEAAEPDPPDRVHPGPAQRPAHLRRAPTQLGRADAGEGMRGLRGKGAQGLLRGRAGANLCFGQLETNIQNDVHAYKCLPEGTLYCFFLKTSTHSV